MYFHAKISGKSLRNSIKAAHRNQNQPFPFLTIHIGNKI